MCAGEPREKAELLFDLIIGKHGHLEVEKQVSQGENRDKALKKLKIDANNPRLMLSIKKIIYFSEIFPKKYDAVFSRPSKSISTIQVVPSFDSNNRK